MAITGLTQLPPEVRTYFDRLLLTLARPYFIYDLFAQKRQIPLNSGDQMVFRRYGTLKVGVGKFSLIDLELLKAA
jgi:N4-gp56 family major capsid protein